MFYSCTNSVGSFGCTKCPDGTIGNGLNGCIDINECATDNGGCSTLANCTNTIAGFVCSNCFNGYAGNGINCNDVNECATLNGGCDSRTICYNVEGSFHCGSCPLPGFMGSGQTGCIDINECAVGNGGCDTRTTSVFCCVVWSCVVCFVARFVSLLDGFELKSCFLSVVCCVLCCVVFDSCSNTNGGFECSVCPLGFSGSPFTSCNDMNECATNNGGCSQYSNCTNSIGSFACSNCVSGFTTSFVGSLSVCTNINECATLNGGCDIHTVCTDTIGSRVCGNCPNNTFIGLGEISLGGGCVDVNECAFNNGGCDVHSNCTNVIGGFECRVCSDGFTTAYVFGGSNSDDNVTICTDIDECATGNADCGGNPCQNVPGGWLCNVCSGGYTGVAGSCVDVNECNVANGGCDALSMYVRMCVLCVVCVWCVFVFVSLACMLPYELRIENFVCLCVLFFVRFVACGVLCCAVLCCAVLCCAVLSCYVC